MTVTFPSKRTPHIGQRRFKSLRAVGALMMREMSTTYGRSPGGYLWAVMEPVAGIALMSVIFGLVMRSPPLGTNFQIFYATGFLPFMFYKEIENKTTTAIRFSKALLFYPSVTYADALIARICLTFITQMMVFFFVTNMIFLFWETRTSVDPKLMISSICAAAILGAGVGTINCFISSFIPLWERLWSVLNRPMVIISGVIFIYDDVPSPWREYLGWNPLVHVIGEMRRAFYPQYRGDYVEILYPIGLGLLLLVVGLILLNRYNRDILNLY